VGTWKWSGWLDDFRSGVDLLWQLANNEVGEDVGVALLCVEGMFVK
jgi:hypothetical protein